MLTPRLALPLLFGACDIVVPRHSAPVADSVGADPAARPAIAPPPGTTTPAASVPAASVDIRATRDAIRGSLRRLVLAEETYFAENGTYTGNLGTLRFAPPSRLAIMLLWADREGWAARGSHPAVPGETCVVYVGRTRPAPATRRYRRQAGEGVPVCDDPPVRPPVASTARGRQDAPAARRMPGVADTMSALDAVNPAVQMKVDLWNLARAQELWFATQGAYARRTEPLAIQYAWHRGVTVRILRADRSSWSARATHARVPGKSCVIWSGVAATVAAPPVDPPRTDGQDRQAVRAGVPVCDDPS